jgi:co-chaperonin GroES (HSP10)
MNMLNVDIKMPEGEVRGAKQLPEPKGFKILIALPELEEKTDGGIYLPEQVRSTEALATVVGFVMKMGDLCYQDEKKFPNGPWCNEGDWVLFRAFSGTRIKIHGKEFRLINDDMVEAVVEDPRGISRV